MSKVRLYGDTSGFVELAAPDVSDDGVLTLPTAAQGILAASGGIGSNVVSTTKTDTFSTTSATFGDVTGLTVSITPSLSTSKVLVVCQWVTGGSADNDCIFRLVRNSTNIYAGTGAGFLDVSVTVRPASTNTLEPASLVFLDSPNTASATTYKLTCRSGTAGQSLVIGRRGADTAYAIPSSITVIEVSA